MISFRALLALVFCVAFFSSPSTAQGLGKYRDFQFGTNIDSVAKQIQMKVSEARTLHERPALIQALEWDQIGYLDVSGKVDPIRSIRFDFYNGDLFKMLVTYNPAGTEGLTPDDVIEAISAVYGKASTPEDSVSISNSIAYENREKVLARWEDEQYSYNLFRFSYGRAFGLLAFSKMLDLMASQASREADRLDKLEAPARELARQKKQEEDSRTAQENARAVNKPGFHP